MVCLSLVACSDETKKTQKAFELSKSAFDNIQEAYKKIDPMGNDILSVWELGVNDSWEFHEYKGFDFFCDNVSLSRGDELNALSYLTYEIEKYNSYEECKEYVGKSPDIYCDVFFE